MCYDCNYLQTSEGSKLEHQIHTRFFILATLALATVALATLALATPG